MPWGTCDRRGWTSGNCSRRSRMRLRWRRSTSWASACRKAIGADDVSFLIADFSGQALIRLEHAGERAAARTQGRETAERVPLAGTPHGRALAGQTVVVEAGGDGGGTRLYAPVTNRGEADRRDRAPPRRRSGRADPRRRRARRARARVRRHRQPALHRPVRVGAALGARCRWRPRSSIACCRGRTRARRGSSRSRPGWSRRRRRRGHVRLLDGSRHAAPLDDRRHGPRGRCGGARHRARRGTPQRSPRRSRTRRAGAPGQRGAPRTSPAEAGS